MQHPDKFSGDETNSTKRTMAFNNWNNQVQARWNMRPQEFNSEKKKLLYAATLLTGSAATGVAKVIEKINASPNDDTNWPYKTGLGLLDHLAGKYATMDLAAAAENTLTDLKQAGRYANFIDFLTEFTTQTDIAGWDDASKVRGMKARLTEELTKAIAVQIPHPAKDDWLGWTRMVSQLAVNAEAEKIQRRSNGGNGGSGSNGGNSGARKEDKGDPMDIDAIKINKLTPEERAHRRTNGLCFKCGRAGHLANACTSSGGNRGGGSGRGGRGGGRGGGQQNNNGNDNANVNNGNNGGNGNNANQYWYTQPQPGNQFVPDFPFRRGGGPSRGGRGGYSGGQQVRFMQVFPAGFAQELPDDAASTTTASDSTNGWYVGQYVNGTDRNQEQGNA
ncbi:hypothetical protein N658DRAFT_511863 [Parathielavia hyrcaniae]|uniref:CCHC-type domain-containing protein n=1 Tax=Parathielavia hyrcaniae TaxID=113614 RepID=A0AAN6PPP9_9PEZI|nr:hypothetical protein N658DRAFT_511863 [Parathielavia hyrcaniae]